jgi:hypothetical protein
VKEMKSGAEGVNFDHLRVRYHRSKREGKSKLLNELCDLYGYNRKYLLQVFNGLTGKRHERAGRKKHYQGDELLEALKRIWLASDQMCSKKLKVAIPMWLPFYDAPIEENIRKQLLTISPATIDRLLKSSRIHYKRHGLSGTKPGYLLKNQIPIKTDHWDVTSPGFMEADTVAHCGNSMAGDFVWSITLTDIATTWTEIRATWNKGAEGVVAGVKAIEEALPFAILGFDSDNGSEFLNWHFMRYFTENREKKVIFTRSRPYRKNDNAHVEQKNWTHVRHLLGYDRFDNSQAVPLINSLYAQEWSLYQNHFIPTMKLVKKEKINSKYRRTYEEPKTPYERVLTSSNVNDETKKKLMKIHNELNPFQLKKNIEKKLRVIFKYVTALKRPRSKI